MDRQYETGKGTKKGKRISIRFWVNFEWSDWVRNLTNYDVYKHLNKAQYRLEKNNAEYCKGNVHYVV